MQVDIIMGLFYTNEVEGQFDKVIFDEIQQHSIGLDEVDEPEEHE